MLPDTPFTYDSRSHVRSLRLHSTSAADAFAWRRGPACCGDAVLPGPNPFSAEEFRLNWSQRDIEQRLGFRGGRFTTTDTGLTFLMGLVFTALFYGSLIFGVERVPGAHWFTAMFTERGFTPYFTMLLFFWGLAILFIKSRKLNLQVEALGLSAVPQQPGFVLNRESARAVLKRVHSLVDDVSHFLLLNRIERALSNLQNIGQISDVATILRYQADYDEEQIASSYGLVQSFLWAIPVLGFIGTVIGLRAAIGALSVIPCGPAAISPPFARACKRSPRAWRRSLRRRWSPSSARSLCSCSFPFCKAAKANSSTPAMTIVRPISASS